MGELRASVEHAFTDALGLELQVPVRLNRTTIQYRSLDGTLLSLDYENIHHRNETLFGLGSMGAGALCLLRWLRAALHARGLHRAPGEDRGGSVRAGRRGPAHQHVQFGSGTVQPLLSLAAERAWDSWSARLWGQAQLSLAENSHGFRAGHRFSIGASGAMKLSSSFRASVGADVANEQPERWEGIVQQDGNLGRTDVLVGGGVSWDVSRVQLGLTLRVPVYTHIIGHHGQLEYPGLLGLTASTVFGK